jgi:asparagine synthetase B (glutamine-hydrolysing)
MAFGVEYRPCLLDRALVQFGLNCPLLAKLEGGTRKALLRKAAALVLPHELCDRPKVPLKIRQVVEDERGWLERIIGIWKRELLDR